MPTPKEHIEQYRKNKNTLNKIMAMDKPPYDWVVTIAFYTAIHLVERFIVEHRHKPSINHEDRMNWVTKIDILKPIRAYYTSLSTSSWQSRYLCVPFDEKKANASLRQLEQIENVLKDYITAE
jgi:hypothetical protein